MHCPFQTKVRKLDPLCDILSAESSNYDAYDLMRYQCNINVIIKRYDQKIRIITRPCNLHTNTVGFELVCYLGDHIIDVSDMIMKNTSDEALQFPQHWILMDLTRDILFDSTILPRDWLQSVIPNIINKDYLINNQYLYLRVDRNICDNDFKQFVHNHYVMMLDILIKLYRRGTICNVGRRFFYAWDLIESNYYPNVFHPVWFNSIMTDGDHTKYLSNALNMDPSAEKYTYSDRLRDHYINRL